MIDSDVKLGKNVKIFDEKLVNIFGCEIRDNTFIGPFVEITRGVLIGKNCLIESHAFICTGTTIEDDVFIGHGTVFTNDLYPRTDRRITPLKTLVKKGSSIGSNSTIIPGITIGKHAVVGCGAVVTKSVHSLSIVVGNPAREIKRFKDLKALKAFIDSKQSKKH